MIKDSLTLLKGDGSEGGKNFLETIDDELSRLVSSFIFKLIEDEILGTTRLKWEGENRRKRAIDPLDEF